MYDGIRDARCGEGFVVVVVVRMMAVVEHNKCLVGNPCGRIYPQAQLQVWHHGHCGRERERGSCSPTFGIHIVLCTIKDEYWDIVLIIVCCDVLG